MSAPSCPGASTTISIRGGGAELGPHRPELLRLTSVGSDPFSRIAREHVRQAVEQADHPQAPVAYRRVRVEDIVRTAAQRS